MNAKIFEIPGKLRSEWDDDVKAVIDIWTDYNITLDQFKTAVLVKGVNYAKGHGGIAWIVDSQNAKGEFSAEIQNIMGTDTFPTFAKIGVKFFITIKSGFITTNKTIDKYSSQVGPNGIQLLDMGSIDDAILWLQANA